MAHSTSTSHYELSQFAASDKPAWLVDYNGDNVKIDNGIYAAAQKAGAAISNFAPAFSSESTYDVGDIVTYENVMYKCIAAVTAAGPWNSNQWDSLTVADVAATVPTGSVSYTDVTDKPQINGITLAGNKTTSELGIEVGTKFTANRDNIVINTAGIAGFAVVQEKNMIVADCGQAQLVFIDIILDFTASTTANKIVLASLSNASNLGTTLANTQAWNTAIFNSSDPYGSAGDVLGTTPVIYYKADTKQIMLQTFNWAGAGKRARCVLTLVLTK